jgi:multidrug efflux system membrane fusion protein
MQSQPWQQAAIQKWLPGGLLVLVLLIWFVGGNFVTSQAGAETPLHAPAAKTAIQVQAFKPEIQRYEPKLQLTGITAPSRQLTLKSERDAVVREVYVDEGSDVSPRQLLARLDSREIQAQLKQAQEMARFRQLDYQASKQLQGKGLVAETRHAEAASALAQAQAEVAQLELLLEASEIRSPFAGHLDRFELEPGMYVQRGQAIGEILDFSQMRIKANLSEFELAHLPTSTTALIELAGDTVLPGQITYLASAADPTTRLVDIEITLAHLPTRPVAGTTAKVQLQLPEQDAHQVSPALFSLDSTGALGLKLVNADNEVLFAKVRLLGSDPQGFWIDALPTDTRIISVGQGFVHIGEKVQVVQP